MCVYLMFQHLSVMEARGNVTEYRAFILHDTCRGPTCKAAVAGCNVGRVAIAMAPAHQNFIRWTVSTDSSYHVAVVAYTAAGCNSSLMYNTVFIPAQKQGLLLFWSAPASYLGF